MKLSTDRRKRPPLPETPEAALAYWLDVIGMQQKQICREIGIAPQKLNDMMHGRRPFDDQLLDWLGFERVTIYRRKKRSSDAE